MADKNLQSITFPGLTDRYVVPQVDNTLTQAGRPADAKKTGDEISELKEDLTQLSDEVVDERTGSNLYDYTKNLENSYLNPNGTMETYNGRYVSDYIPVTSGKTLRLSYISGNNTITSAGYAAVCCYDSNKNVVSGGDYNKAKFTVPNGVAYVRFTLSGTFNDAKTQITESDDGSLPTTFEYYVGSSKHLCDDMIVSNPALGYMQTIGDISDGQSLNLPYHNVKNNNVLVFNGKITEFGSIKVGKETDTYIVVDDTNITLTSDFGSITETHGLTIANDIQIIIENETSVNASLIRVVSSGVSYEMTPDHRFIMDNGYPYVTSIGSTLTDCIFTWTSRSINKPIWLFGDSYFSFYQSRWIYYLAEDGFTASCMLNGYAGEGSVDAMTALQNLLSVRVPEYVVWCIGMNNPDGSSAISNVWKYNYTALIGLANHYGFKLILATIPNTPTINNSFKNAVVRESGYRYIDFSDAVNVDNEGNWITGALSEDNVHPTVTGAKILYMRALADFPELTSL